MKLSQLYSDQPFKNITFNKGFNVILGKIKRPEDYKKHSHNLGKTLLLHLIDFMLAKKVDSTSFLKKNEKYFADYTFYLEIQLNSGSFLTIKRIIKKLSKISFKLHKEPFQNFIQENEWDYVDLPLGKAQTFLNDSLGYDILQEYKYRKTVSYFLRTQYDYRDEFQLDKFRQGKDKEWKPMLLAILGYNSSELQNKYELDENIELQNKVINNYERQHAIRAEEEDKITGLIELKEIEKEQLQNKVDKFDFYLKEQNISRQLVEDIENRISELNSLDYDFSYKLEKINQSLENSIEFDIEEVKAIFNEAQIHFSDQLVKSYNELTTFNKKLFCERRKHLKERKNEISENKQQIDTELHELNEKRSEYLTMLVEKDSFKKFKSYQRSLGSIDEEIRILKDKLKDINYVEKLKEVLEKSKEDLEKAKKKIKKIVNTKNNSYANIRRDFNQIVSNVINRTALISKSINNLGNVEFQCDIQHSVDRTLTSEGSGYTYKKILCAAFDIALLANYANKSFYRFVYHDGIFESLDNRPKQNFLKLIRNYCEKYNIQYILTIIEDDLPRNEKGQIIPFNTNEIVLELSDEGAKGKLFEMDF